jgi:hypothetical protein
LAFHSDAALSIYLPYWLATYFVCETSVKICNRGRIELNDASSKSNLAEPYVAVVLFLYAKKAAPTIRRSAPSPGAADRPPLVCRSCLLGQLTDAAEIALKM